MYATLGDAIRAYRLRQRQLHNGQPWTQEDLAVAIGTDKAHVNRIERSRQRPELKTLLAMCRALDLSEHEWCHLVSLAGYGLHLPPVTQDEVTSVLQSVARLIESSTYPIVVYDDCERVLDMNELHARLWGSVYGGSDRQTCLAKMRGRFVIERLFEPTGQAALRSLVEDPERVLLRTVRLFGQAYWYHPQDPNLSQALERLERDAEFVRLWHLMLSSQARLIFAEHDVFTLHCPDVGSLVFNSARTHLLWTDRFSVVHHWPADAHTAEALMALKPAPGSDRLAG